MPYADTYQRLRLITGLRTLAEYLEANPEVPAPCGTELMVFVQGSDHAQRIEIDRVARLVGTRLFVPDSFSRHYRVTRNFDPVAYSVIAIPNAVRASHDALMTYDGAVIADASEEM
ncbi:hypothetical protein ACIBI3_11395 [Actinomadura luteofluorescens]|uniref:hypothetical protein n=1 Tax=Actinomadura luteofluorescens TaxID=46163 RepID=UPI003476FDEC